MHYSVEVKLDESSFYLQLSGVVTMKQLFQTQNCLMFTISYQIWSYDHLLFDSLIECYYYSNIELGIYYIMFVDYQHVLRKHILKIVSSNYKQGFVTLRNT